jgi:hypothetical protein
VGEPVLVRWEDAASHDLGWINLGEAIEVDLVEVTSVGFLVRVTQKAIYLVADRHSLDGDIVHGVGVIPIRWLNEVKRLYPVVG